MEEESDIAVPRWIVDLVAARKAEKIAMEKLQTAQREYVAAAEAVEEAERQGDLWQQSMIAAASVE